MESHKVLLVFVANMWFGSWKGEFKFSIEWTSPNISSKKMCFLGIEHVDCFKMYPNMNLCLHLKNAPKIKKYLGNMEIIFWMDVYFCWSKQTAESAVGLFFLYCDSDFRPPGSWNWYIMSWYVVLPSATAVGEFPWGFAVGRLILVDGWNPPQRDGFRLKMFIGMYLF